MEKNYSELLKSPKWQKKRLEIMKRDKFTCKKCGDTESQLHVHHKKYINGRSPWEYDNKDLITLCENCHAVITSISKVVPDFDINEFKAFKLKSEFGRFEAYNYKNKGLTILVTNPSNACLYFDFNAEQTHNLGKFLL
jgi:hypothetical protein